MSAPRAWIDTGLVFITHHGTPIEPRNFVHGGLVRSRRAGSDYRRSERSRYTDHVASEESSPPLEAALRWIRTQPELR